MSSRHECCSQEPLSLRRKFIDPPATIQRDPCEVAGPCPPAAPIDVAMTGLDSRITLAEDRLQRLIERVSPVLAGGAFKWAPGEDVQPPPESVCGASLVAMRLQNLERRVLSIAVLVDALVDRLEV